MNPSTTTPSESFNLQDPIRRLPREVFIQFFSSRDCKFILDSSTVSREWKDVLLSSPTLYENLELYFEDEDPGEENNLAQHAIANKTIKRILGYANLSNNRLKSVDLCFSPFAHDVRNAYSNWNATRSSVLFNILSWSSSTLTSLKLEFTTHSEELNSAILHTATIVKNLGCLRSLQKVEIQSDLAVRLKSSSPFREILVVDQYGTRDWNDEEVDEVHGSTLAILLRQITDFTGLGIKTAVLGQDYRVSSEALEELEKSKDSLLDLSLKLEVGNVLSISKFQLALKCPNLKSLVLEMWSQERETSGESLRLEVPKDKEYPNKLKSLVINNLTEAALILGEKFCRSLVLEVLSIEQEDIDFDSPSINSKSILQILQSSHCSLQSLHLSKIKFSSALTDGLQLQHLVRLSVSGNADLIMFFLDIGYVSLKTLLLSLWYFDEDGSDRIDHSKIVQIFQSCQSSLEEVDIWFRCKNSSARTVSASQEEAKSTLEDHQSSLTLTKVSYLSLDFQDDLIEKYYIPMKYPNLSRVGLANSSKLSQSDFSLKPQAFTPK